MRRLVLLLFTSSLFLNFVRTARLLLSILSSLSASYLNFILFAKLATIVEGLIV